MIFLDIFWVSGGFSEYMKYMKNTLKIFRCTYWLDQWDNLKDWSVLVLEGLWTFLSWDWKLFRWPSFSLYLQEKYLKNLVVLSVCGPFERPKIRFLVREMIFWCLGDFHINMKNTRKLISGTYVIYLFIYFDLDVLGLSKVLECIIY